MNAKRLLSRGLLLIASCALFGVGVATEPTTRPFVVGHLDAKPLRESSGIVASRKYPGIYWTHNDSGNAPVIYAVRRDGSLVNAFPVRCVSFDWEDIAIDDDGHLYLGDIGNNGNLRGAIGVMMIDEPDPNFAPDPKKPIEPQQRWPLTFQDDQRMDCESLFVWKGFGYLIKKSVDRSPTTLWRFSLDETKQQPIEFVATLPIDAICTGADLSADGDQLAVMCTDGPYLFTGLAGEMKSIETAKFTSIRIEPRTNEAICFTSEAKGSTADGLLGTSEARDVYFFPWDGFKALPTSKPTK